MTSQIIQVRLHAASDSETVDCYRAPVDGLVDINYVVCALADPHNDELTILNLSTGMVLIVEMSVQEFNQIWSQYVNWKWTWEGSN